MSAALAKEVIETAAATAYESPYVGLRTYEEKDANKYFGREDIVAELGRMVKRAPLTVLFGVSGTGKSSLLRAGLFPNLRKEQHIPVLIRLDFTAGERELREQVRARTTQELDDNKVDTARPPAGMSLRDYFALHPWWSQRNKLLAPFLVFDQFEEIFTIGRSHREQVVALMDELAELVERPALDIEAQADITAPRPRLMFVLREDFLAPLEDFRVRMPSLARNRYRLTRMNGAQAFRAVLDPARDIVDEATAKKIVRFVAGGAASVDVVVASEADEEKKHPLDTLEVEPAILSLVCEQLDLQRYREGLPNITGELIRRQGGKIVESFYEQAFRTVSTAARALVEDHLVTTDGYRTTMAKAEALGTPGVNEADIKQLLDKKILREEVRFGSLHIELIHDRLTKIASHGRARRREEERERLQRRKWQRRGVIAAAVLGFLGVVTVFMLREANAKRQRAEELRRAKASESAGLLVREGREALLRGDALSAADRLRRAQGFFRDAHVPVPPEAALLFKRAAIELAGRVMTINHGSATSCLRAVGTDRMITCGLDGSLRVWQRDAQPVNLEKDFGVYDGGAPIASTHPSHAGDWVLVLRTDGSGELRGRVDSTKPLFPFDAPGNSVLTAQQAQQNIGPSLKGPFPKKGSGPAPNAYSRTSQQTAKADTSFTWRACVAPDDTAFAVWSPEVAGVRIWSGKNWEPSAPGWLDVAQVRDVVCLGKATFVVVPDASTFAVVDARGMQIGASTGFAPRVIKHIAGASTGRRVAIVFEDSNSGAYLIDPHAPQDMVELRTPLIDHLELSADGNHLLITARGGDRTFIGIWDGKDRGLDVALERPRATARMIGKVLVVASGRDVEAWNIVTGAKLGATSFEFDLDGARVDLAVEGQSYVVAAAVQNRASLRRLELSPDWSDRQLIAAPEDLGPWLVQGNPLGSRAIDQRRAGPVSLEVQGGRTLLLKDGNATRARLDVGESFVDARLTRGKAVRVALLRGDGTVTVLDDQLREIAALGARAVRAIRWTSRGELITLGWSWAQVWSADGAKVNELPVSGDDAALVYQPRRALWLCEGPRCSAWDPKSNQELARSTFEGSERVELDPSSEIAIARSRPTGRWTFLPVVGSASNVLEPSMVTQLAPMGEYLVVAYESGTSYVWSDEPPAYQIARGPLVPQTAGSEIVAASGAKLFVAAVDAFAERVNPVWEAATALLLARVRGDRLGVIDSDLELVVLDRAKLGSPDPIVMRGGKHDVIAGGRGAVFSPQGRRYAMVTPRNTIEVRSLGNPAAVSGGYALEGRHARSVLVPDAETPLLVALTDGSIAIWNAPGKPAHVLEGMYRDAVLDGTGTYLVGLRLDRHAEVYRIEAGVPQLLRTLRAVTVALDPRGTRLAVADGAGGIDIYQVSDFAKRNRYTVDASIAPSLVLSPPAGKYMWIASKHELVSVAQPGPISSALLAAQECVFAGDGEAAACVFEERGNVFLQAVVAGQPSKRLGQPVRMPRKPDRVIACSSRDSKIGLALANGNTTTLVVLDAKQLGGAPTRVVAQNVTGCTVANQDLWTVTDAGLLQRFSVMTGELTRAYGGATVLDAALDADAFAAAIGGPLRDVTVTTVTRTTTIKRVIENSRGIEHAVFLGNKELACALRRQDNLLKIWPVSSGPARNLFAARTPVSALAALGELLAAGHEDGMVEIWQPGAEKPHAVFPGYGAPARRIAIDDSGRWIATAYDDGSVSVWLLDDDDTSGRREPLLRLDTRTAGAAAIAFEHGDPALALITGGADGEVRRWSLGGAVSEQALDDIDRALKEVPGKRAPRVKLDAQLPDDHDAPPNRTPTAPKPKKPDPTPKAPPKAASGKKNVPAAE